MPRIRTSRRVPPLKDSDYDHEIVLVDDVPLSKASSSAGSPGSRASVSAPVPTAASTCGSPAPPDLARTGCPKDPAVVDTASVTAEVSSTIPTLNEIPPTPATATLESNGLQNTVHQRESNRSQHQPEADRDTEESEIDILYENQRGGVFCGLSLFSSQALGGIDHPAWTNIAHKPSLTNTDTATVPDPSWEWAWPEWKVNHDKGVDKDGWEYSFMFSKKFSWHGPKWWNSFVRRRAWIRRRIRRHHRQDCEDEDLSVEPGRLNTDYFTVRPAAESVRSRSSSIASIVSRASGTSRVSRSSLVVSNASNAELDAIPDITDLDMLFAILRCLRIDREKIEAVENYLRNCRDDDLARLQDKMHDIMKLLVFQSSRQILLTRLTKKLDEIKKIQRNKDSFSLQERSIHLKAAIKHADEEVRELQYWSDIKGMAERGESGGAVDNEEGWDRRFRGLDNSGPAPPLMKSKPGDAE